MYQRKIVRKKIPLIVKLRTDSLLSESQTRRRRHLHPSLTNPHALPQPSSVLNSLNADQIIPRSQPQQTFQIPQTVQPEYVSPGLIVIAISSHRAVSM